MKLLKAFFASALLLALSLLPAASAKADTNLISNPSFETATASAPTGWSKGSWGTNTAAFTYENTGHTGTHSATVSLSAYASGDAKWYFAPVTVTPNTAYTFSDWYKSTVASEIDAVVTTTTGATNYFWVASTAVSANWQQATSSFAAPANAKSVTFYHVIFGNGSLTTDDYSLTSPTATPPPAPTAPTVSVTAPANNATVAGSLNVTANAGDTLGVTSVQFKLDGANLGAADTTAPYSTTWNTTTATNAGHTLTAVATNTSGLTTTATNVAVTVNNTVVTPPTAPTVAFSAPAANATVKATVPVTATATDAVSIKSVQFKLDGVAAATVTTAPYTYNWDTTKATNGVHTLTATATNASNLTTTATETVTVANPTAPVVSVTAPANNATVSGSQTITATATDAVAVTSVQFKLDGVNFGTPITAAPYTTTWNTATATNATHTITATATNGANLSTTSAVVSVTVNNVVVTPPTNPANLILNPSFETATAGLPNNWHGDGWGTNTHTMTYENTGHTGGHSVKTTISSYTSGDAKWYFDDVTVTPGTNYQYSNWYQSNVDTEVDAQVTSTTGAVSYYYIGTAPANSTWAQVKAQFVAPAGAKSITIFQVITKVGYVQIDDANFGPFTPAAFNRAMVTLTFDDGWRNQYTNALPLLDKYGMKATFYIISNTSADPAYMTVAMMQAIKNDGQEMADHTVSHPHLPTLTVAQIDAEMGNSQAQLRTWFGNDGVVGANFATPYGEYNNTVLTEAKKYFRSHRSTDDGYNSKDSFDIYNIRVQNIIDTTTPAQVAAWVAQAQKDKTWLVLVYHLVSADPTKNQEDYSVTPANLDAELNQMKQSGIAVETINQALNEIQPQL